jgi:hypothetical protein
MFPDALKQPKIIPRTPSPEPLEDRPIDELALGEARELFRRQKVRLAMTKTTILTHARLRNKTRKLASRRNVTRMMGTVLRRRSETTKPWKRRTRKSEPLLQDLFGRRPSQPQIRSSSTCWIEEDIKDRGRCVWKSKRLNLSNQRQLRSSGRCAMPWNPEYRTGELLEAAESSRKAPPDLPGSWLNVMKLFS